MLKLTHREPSGSTTRTRHLSSTPTSSAGGPRRRHRAEMDNFRWLTVGAAQARGGVALMTVTGPPSSTRRPRTSSRRWSRRAPRAACSSPTDDCRATYEELKARASSSARSRPSSPTASTPASATRSATSTGWCSGWRSRPKRPSRTAGRRHRARVRWIGDAAQRPARDPRCRRPAGRRGRRRRGARRPVRHAALRDVRVRATVEHPRVAAGARRGLAVRRHARAGLAQGEPLDRPPPHLRRRGRRLRRVRPGGARDRAGRRSAAGPDLGQRLDQAGAADRQGDRHGCAAHRRQHRGAGNRRGRRAGGRHGGGGPPPPASRPDRRDDGQRVHRGGAAGRGGGRLQAGHPRPT